MVRGGGCSWVMVLPVAPGVGSEDPGACWQGRFARLPVGRPEKSRPSRQDPGVAAMAGRARRSCGSHVGVSSGAEAEAEADESKSKSKSKSRSRSR